MNKLDEIIEKIDKNNWGACFECCDYERLLKEIRQACKDYAKACVPEEQENECNCKDEYCDCGFSFNSCRSEMIQNIEDN